MDNEVESDSDGVSDFLIESILKSHTKFRSPNLLFYNGTREEFCNFAVLSSNSVHVKGELKVI